MRRALVRRVKEMQAKREESQQELRTQLSGVLNETQLKKFEALHEGRGFGPGRLRRQERAWLEDGVGHNQLIAVECTWPPAGPVPLFSSTHRPAGAGALEVNESSPGPPPVHSRRLTAGRG